MNSQSNFTPQMPVMCQIHSVRMDFKTMHSQASHYFKQSILDEGHMEIRFWTACSRGGRMGNSSASSFHSPFFILQLGSLRIPLGFRDYLDPAGSLWGSQCLWWSRPAQTQVWLPLSHQVTVHIRAPVLWQLCPDLYSSTRSGSLYQDTSCKKTRCGTKSWKEGHSQADVGWGIIQAQFSLSNKLTKYLEKQYIIWNGSI